MKQSIIRIFSIALVLCLSVGLVACGGDASSASDSSSGSDATSTGFDYSENLTNDGKWKGVTALDYVTLPDYKGFDIPQADIAASAEDIDALIKNELESYVTYEEITNRAIVADDLVNIDYVGTVDGVAFTGGDTGGAGTLVTAGSENYIDDFLTQIIGHKAGDTFDVVVTFPEGYSDGTDADGNTVVLAEKEAVFATTINYIRGEKIYPEVTDAFVKETFSESYGWNTAEDMNADIVKSIESSNKYNLILEKLMDETTVTEVPEVILNSLVNIQVADLEAQVKQYGMDLASYLSMMGLESVDAYKAQLMEDLSDTAKQYLIFQAIAENEKMVISDADVLTNLGGYAESAVAFYGNGYVKLQVTATNVGDLLLEAN